MTGSKMGKAAVLEHQRLSGAIRCGLIARKLCQKNQPSER